MSLLVGTYTDADSEGIYITSFDESEGTFTDPTLAVSTENPSFLAISDDRRFVFAVNESNEGAVSAFAFEGNELTLIKSVSTFGAHPCFIDYQPGLVAVANYSSGNGGLLSVSENGSLSKALSEFQHYGSGANLERQESPHAHFARFSPDGRFLYVIDLGIDQVLAYPISDGKIGPASTALTMEPGDGPRHLDFHPTMDYVYVISELSNTITVAAVDHQSGKFRAMDRISTLPDDFIGESYCADIHISSDGRFVYGSNRGHNSIAIFAVGEDGLLNLQTTEPTKGDWPRNFALSPNEQFLLVANQNSNNVVAFERDKKTGLLNFTGNEITISKPVCLKF
ncbi:MAG: lactonase family protein [Marinoscillum sp.]